MPEPSLISAPRMLVLRHASYRHDFYDVLTDWITRHHPEHADLLELRELPFDLPADAAPGRPYGAVVPWLQDPVQLWSMETFAQTQALQARCDALGIPVLNRVECLAHAGKAEAARRLAAAGIRVPRMARILDLEAFGRTQYGIPFPLFVRDDWGHGSDLYGARTPEEARLIPVGKFERPVAVQWINVRDADGLYRKYRHFAAGDAGISHHLQCSREWVTRGHNRVIDERTQSEELAYVSAPDPHAALFQRARRALELDMVAFDYSLCADGVPVIWEANPFPLIQFSKGSLVYRNGALHRTLHAMLRLYLRAAGRPVPAEIEDVVAYRRDPAEPLRVD